MKQRDEFIGLVHAELDARRDPLDCTSVTAWLSEHPEELEEFANLRTVGLQLVHIAQQPSKITRSAPRRWWRSLAPLAAAATVAVFVFSVLPKPVEQSEALPSSMQAQLISLSVSSQQQVETFHFAPADPTTGAVILSMKSTTRETTY